MIRNQDMEYMNGRMDGHIRVILKMIIVMGMVSYMMAIKWYIRDIGKMDNKLQQRKEYQN